MPFRVTSWLDFPKWHHRVCLCVYMYVCDVFAVSFSECICEPTCPGHPATRKLCRQAERKSSYGWHCLKPFYFQFHQYFLNCICVEWSKKISYTEYFSPLGGSLWDDSSSDDGLWILLKWKRLQSNVHLVQGKWNTFLLDLFLTLHWHLSVGTVILPYPLCQILDCVLSQNKERGYSEPSEEDLSTCMINQVGRKHSAKHIILEILSEKVFTISLCLSFI